MNFQPPGKLDDVQIHDSALTQEEIQAVMEGAGLGRGSGMARRPSPEDGAIHEATWVNLSWSPGPYALSHDVYISESFDDVNDSMHESETFRGNQATTFIVVGFPGFPYPDGLVPGTTYYWRIDKVNDADPNSP